MWLAPITKLANIRRAVGVCSRLSAIRRTLSIAPSRGGRGGYRRNSEALAGLREPAERDYQCTDPLREGSDGTSFDLEDAPDRPLKATGSSSHPGRLRRNACAAFASTGTRSACAHRSPLSLWPQLDQEQTDHLIDTGHTAPASFRQVAWRSVLRRGQGQSRSDITPLDCSSWDGRESASGAGSLRPGCGASDTPPGLELPYRMCCPTQHRCRPDLQHMLGEDFPSSPRISLLGGINTTGSARRRIRLAQQDPAKPVTQSRSPGVLTLSP